MALRTLKRKVIIREYDYAKVAKEVADLRLYDRASFLPLNQTNLEQLKVFEILQGKEHTPLVSAEWNGNIPSMLLYNLKDYLYNVRYYDWRVTVDEEGYLCVQARKNTPKGRIGWGVFEKDFESRI